MTDDLNANSMDTLYWRWKHSERGFNGWVALIFAERPRNRWYPSRADSYRGMAARERDSPSYGNLTGELLMTDDSAREQAIQRFAARLFALGQDPQQALGRRLDSKQCGGELHLDSGGGAESCRALVATTFDDARAVAVESLVIGRHDRVFVGQPGEKTYLTVIDLTIDSRGSLELLGDLDILVAGTLEQLPESGDDEPHEPKTPGDDQIGLELFAGIVMCQAVGPLHGPRGDTGSRGARGSDGKHGDPGRSVGASIYVPAHCAKPPSSAKSGKAGGAGQHGNAGGSGSGAGRVACEASMIAGALVLHVGGGDGGRGGDGGPGGDGGKGGSVSPKGLCRTSVPVNAGNGGDGGPGGKGGDGGRGGDGGQFTLRYRNMGPGAHVAVRRRHGSGGLGGAGSLGGTGGAGGRSTAAFGRRQGARGAAGKPGEAGVHGQDGTATRVTIVKTYA